MYYLKKLLKINCSYLCFEEDTLMKNTQTISIILRGQALQKKIMNYILAVKNMEKLPYNYNLTKVGMVIQRLQPYEFEQKKYFQFYSFGIFIV